MAAASLELAGISKRYPGVQALSEVSFECRPGEVHAVLGENGSGKSTLLGIASGSVAADEGRVAIMGEALTSADPMLARRLGLAAVYQDDSLVRELTVADNLILGAKDDHASLRGRQAWAQALIAQFDLGVAPDAMVGDLNPAQRQFLEIVKALATNPSVLLLDEPTSTLDHSGVEKLAGIVEQIVAGGAAVVYVSHRLPEILALADRVTILRDGVSRGTYVIDDRLSESDLVALMVGRPIEQEFPGEHEATSKRIALSVEGLVGPRFQGVSFQLSPGEILGFAGAEGNGQREALRALGGLIEANGSVTCEGRRVAASRPRDALNAGIPSISADRAAESIFPPLGVGENITIQVLQQFAASGLISTRAEKSAANALVDELNIVAASLDQPVSGLSGGNQQKAVLARSFLLGARVMLIDEPTQGVDANARFDIYRAIRAKAGEGVAFIINSSDALELAGLCDRVLIFSRGHVIRELRGKDLTEESIVSSFLRSKEVAANGKNLALPGGGRLSLIGLGRLVSGNQRWTPLVFLALLVLAVGGYASAKTDVFLTSLNLRHILYTAAPLALVTMAQFTVLMVRGFDISVGSLMSLTVVVASFMIASEIGAAAILLGVALCLLVGLAVGVANGVLVRFVGINSVITTIATLSVVQGISLYLRPSPLGAISDDFMEILRTRVGFVPISLIVIVLSAIAADIWLYRTRSGLKTRAVGYREEAAKRNGVHVNFVHLRAYILSALIATLAGLFLASEVGVGHPVIGSGYTLTSIAAAVLGGASLAGGRGSYLGAVLGALFFTLTTNIITLVGLSTGAGIIASGALTLFAVLLYSGLQPLRTLLQGLRRATRGRMSLWEAR
jgi:ribose transport system ATP-binding protein